MRLFQATQAARGVRVMRLTRLLVACVRLKLARYAIKISMALALLGKRYLYETTPRPCAECAQAGLINHAIQSPPIHAGGPFFRRLIAPFANRNGIDGPASECCTAAIAVRLFGVRHG